MIVSKVTYTGSLHTKATHLKSNSDIETDAPVDNNGKGEAFSPTDLMATSLASCMLTVMGIYARDEKIDISGTVVTVDKKMGINPRRITGIGIDMKIPVRGLSESQKNQLEEKALTCPVLFSLHPEIKKEFNLEFVNPESTH